jgi:hypothetical protein
MDITDHVHVFIIIIMSKKKIDDNPGDIMVPYFERFINETDWRILIWSGDVDAAVPFIGTQRWIECLGQDVKRDWNNWFTNDVK